MGKCAELQPKKTQGILQQARCKVVSYRLMFGAVPCFMG